MYKNFRTLWIPPTFQLQCEQQGLWCSSTPKHLCVSSPGPKWKGSDPNELYWLSRANTPPSMFTVNGNLCPACLLCLSRRPRLYATNLEQTCSLLSPVLLTQAHYFLEPRSSSIWPIFLCVTKKTSRQRGNENSPVLVSVGLVPALSCLHAQIRSCQIRFQTAMTSPCGASRDTRLLGWQVKMNGRVSLPTSPTPGCQIEDLMVEFKTL